MTRDKNFSIDLVVLEQELSPLIYFHLAEPHASRCVHHTVH